MKVFYPPPSTNEGQPSYVESYFSDVFVEGGLNYPRGISASRLAKNKIPTAIPMFSGSNLSMVPSVTHPDQMKSRNPRWLLK